MDKNSLENLNAENVKKICRKLIIGDIMSSRYTHMDFVKLKESNESYEEILNIKGSPYTIK